MLSHLLELLLRVLALQSSLLWLFIPTVLADNHTNPISIFHSVSSQLLPVNGISYWAIPADSEEPQRPDLKAPILTIINQTQELVTPGYIFIAPYQAYQEGPYIYDNDGVGFQDTSLYYERSWLTSPSEPRLDRLWRIRAMGGSRRPRL
jgi:hypothetical protein